MRGHILDDSAIAAWNPSVPKEKGAMMKASLNIKMWLRQHALGLFFVLAIVFSWSIEIPLVLSTHRIIIRRIPPVLHYLAGYGPLLAAWIVTGLVDGQAGLRNLLERMLQWRVQPFFWVFALSPLLIFCLIVLVDPAQGSLAALHRLGLVEDLPNPGLMALPFWFFTFGIGEETGWRGFALPRLQVRHKALHATVILWATWSFWHLPMFFYRYNSAVVPGMLLGLLAGAVTLTWIYNSTHGSVLVSAVWHSTFNLTTACTSCNNGIEPAILSAVVMVWAVLIIVLYKTTSLSKARRCVAIRCNTDPGIRQKHPPQGPYCQEACLGDNHATYGDQVIYQIAIASTLDASWSAWFGGMHIIVQENGATLMSGPVRDQAALHGLLIKIRDMGLVLISVRQVKQQGVCQQKNRGTFQGTTASKK